MLKPPKLEEASFKSKWRDFVQSTWPRPAPHHVLRRSCPCVSPPFPDSSWPDFEQVLAVHRGCCKPHVCPWAVRSGQGRHESTMWSTWKENNAHQGRLWLKWHTLIHQPLSWAIEVWDLTKKHKPPSTSLQNRPSDGQPTGPRPTNYTAFTPATTGPFPWSSPSPRLPEAPPRSQTPWDKTTRRAWRGAPSRSTRRARSAAGLHWIPDNQTNRRPEEGESGTMDQFLWITCCSRARSSCVNQATCSNVWLAFCL